MLRIKLNYSIDDIKETIAVFKKNWDLTTTYNSFRKVSGKNQYLIIFEAIKSDINLTIELNKNSVQVGGLLHSHLEEYKGILYSMLSAFEVVAGEDLELTISHDSSSKYILDKDLSDRYKYGFTTDMCSFFTNHSELGEKVTLNRGLESQLHMITDEDLSKLGTDTDEFMIIKSEVRNRLPYSLYKTYNLEVCKNASDIISIFISETEIIINKDKLSIRNPDLLLKLDESIRLVDVIAYAFKYFEIDFLLKERKMNLKDKFGFRDMSDSSDTARLIDEIKAEVNGLLPIPPARTVLSMMKYIQNLTELPSYDYNFRLDFKSHGLVGNGQTDFKATRYVYEIKVDELTTEKLDLYLLKSSRGFHNECWELLTIKKADSYDQREIAILFNSKVTSYYLAALETE